ncbi:hypothetical protein BJ742DRAFT_739597 [Cladochytrium replicatum]|nr:hypothetical protein BJ742DRAFT_739597 [Cladochytrium replicatum]
MNLCDIRQTFILDLDHSGSPNKTKIAQRWLGWWVIQIPSKKNLSSFRARMLLPLSPRKFTSWISCLFTPAALCGDNPLQIEEREDTADISKREQCAECNNRQQELNQEKSKFPKKTIPPEFGFDYDADRTASALNINNSNLKIGTMELNPDGQREAIRRAIGPNPRRQLSQGHNSTENPSQLPAINSMLLQTPSAGCQAVPAGARCSERCEAKDLAMVTIRAFGGFCVKLWESENTLSAELAELDLFPDSDSSEEEGDKADEGRERKIHRVGVFNIYAIEADLSDSTIAPSFYRSRSAAASSSSSNFENAGNLVEPSSSGVGAAVNGQLSPSTSASGAGIISSIPWRTCIKLVQPSHWTRGSSVSLEETFEEELEEEGDLSDAVTGGEQHGALVVKNRKLL